MPEMGKDKLTPTALAFLCFAFAGWLISPGVSLVVGAEKISTAKSMGYAKDAEMLLKDISRQGLSPS